MATPTSSNGGGGLFQGFRKKMGRYGTTGAAAGSEGKKSEMEMDKDAPPALAAAVREFSEQDQLLRRLDGELGTMLQELQLTCTSMLQVARLFSKSLRSETVTHQLSAEFLENVERIVRDGIDITEQSIRFTVVDPLAARLERHNQLITQLTARNQLAQSRNAAREAVEHIIAAGLPEVDERRRKGESKLAALEMELDGIQRELLPIIEDLTHGQGFSNQNDLFAAMRLHLATFFFNGNKSLFPSLSATEMEIVTGATYSNAQRTLSTVSQPSSQPSSTSYQLHKMSSITSEDWSEIDGTSFPEDEDIDTVSRPSITLEEFELGRSPPNLSDMLARANNTSSTLPLAVPTLKAPSEMVDPEELKIVAAHPVVLAHSNDEDNHSSSQRSEGVSSDSDGIEMTSVLSPPRSRLNQLQSPSMFTSFRNSFRGKLGGTPRPRSPRARTPNGSDGLADAGYLVVSPTGTGGSSPKSPRRRHKGAPSGSTPAIGLSPAEWKAIQACLWDIDVRKGPQRESESLPDTPCYDLLSCLLREQPHILHECLSMLQLHELASVSMVNRHLRSHMLGCPPLWKQCIRSSGLGQSRRHTVWLAAFYEVTPWRSDDGALPHLLSRETRKRMYEQLVLKVGTKLTEAAMHKEPATEEDIQLLSWMHEIDVDVARTCHKDIYANEPDESDEEYTDSKLKSTRSHASLSTPSGGSSETNETSAGAESLTSSAKNQINAEALKLTEEPLLKSPRSDDDASTHRALLEAKTRRVLRAYVVYNPRVGYCQGMSFLVRLLAEVADDEADIFWLFVGFSEPENDRNLYEPGLAVLQPFLSKYEVLFSTHMPELYEHFQQEGVHVASFCTRWFMTLFSSFETAGPRLVVRLLDIFAIDGWRIIFSMALVVLDELRGRLERADMEGILKVLQSPRTYMATQNAIKRRQLLRHALAFSISQTINSI